MKKVYYYDSFQEDVLETKNQTYQLKEHYQWLHSNPLFQLASFLLYFPVLCFAFFYAKCCLHLTIKNKKILRKEKGYFLYCNHTQMLGDVFNPFLICFPRRPKIICSPANLGIPFLGKLLALGGALPIPVEIHDMIRFKEAVATLTEKGNPILIYPESHLWPYATMIRDFSKTSFHYPVETKKKVFVGTLTYTHQKRRGKPKMTLYLDGPFQCDAHLSKKENIDLLHHQVYETMKKRSQQSDFAYVTYQKRN